MTDEEATADWVVKTCSCGFDGGDGEHEFDTAQEAREFVDWLANSDSSLLDVIGPNGSIVTKLDPLMNLYADALSWPADTKGAE